MLISWITLLTIMDGFCVRGGIDRAFWQFSYLPDTHLSLLYLITCINALEHNFYFHKIGEVL
jgi:hypothetical protein